MELVVCAMDLKPLVTRDDAGIRRSFVNGLLHSTDDLPAIISKPEIKTSPVLPELGDKQGPQAVTIVGGALQWWYYGMVHRDNGPAYVGEGFALWYQYGRLHRDGDQPAFLKDGKQIWYQHGVRHRVGRPAVICDDGWIEWWEDGKQIGERQQIPNQNI